MRVSETVSNGTDLTGAIGAVQANDLLALRATIPIETDEHLERQEDGQSSQAG